MDILELAILSMRLAGALVLIGFLPGLALSWWMFAKSPLDPLERAFISIITSLVISGFVAYGLVIIEVGVSPLRLTAGLLALTLLFGAGAVHARREQGSFSEILFERLERVGQVVLQHRTMVVLVGLFVVALVTGAAFSLQMGQTNNSIQVTEFYIVPENLSPNGLVYTIAGGTLQVPVAITNREGQARTYRIESLATQNANSETGMLHSIVPVDHSPAVATDGIQVGASETWTGTVSVPLPSPAAAYVEIELYYEGVFTPLATLRIWLTDSE